jgi:hypothetical protein
MSSFVEHSGFRRLSSLGLPTEDFVVAGSGPLFARHWMTDPSDVDVVARGIAWEMAAQLGDADDAPYSTVKRILLFDGSIEVLNGWFPEIWSVDRLIEDADVFLGFRFLTLPTTIATKRMLGRPRDMLHLEILRRHGWDIGAQLSSDTELS